MGFRRSTSLKYHYDPSTTTTQVSLRPIVSYIGSPTYQLAKHVTSLITPLTGRTSSFVKNSRHFVEMMKEVRLSEDEMMVSFDINSLFTNVQVDEAWRWYRKNCMKMIP